MERRSYYRWLMAVAMQVGVLTAAVFASSVAWAQQANTVDTAPISIGPGQSVTVNVKAFCLDFGKPFPTNFPSISGTANPQMTQLLRYAISKGYTDSDPYQVQLAL